MLEFAILVIVMFKMYPRFIIISSSPNFLEVSSLMNSWNLRWTFKNFNLINISLLGGIRLNGAAAVERVELVPGLEKLSALIIPRENAESEFQTINVDQKHRM